MSRLIRAFEPRLNIVKSGLVLWLDSSLQTSYNGTDTTPFPSVTQWNDLSGVGNTTDTLYDVEATNGVFDFDGIDDYARINRNVELTAFTNQITIEMWISFESPVDYSCPIIKTTSNAWTDGWGLFKEGSSVKFFINLYNGAQTVAATTDSNLSHYVATYDGANLRIYKNNTLIQTSSSFTANINNSTNFLYIGAGTTYYFSGKIPQVRVYNRALTASEITHNFNQTRSRFGI